MIELENVEVIGWEHAIRGMRNPMNSWDKSDSDLCVELGSTIDNCPSTCPYFLTKDDCYGAENDFIIGPNDYKLMMKLRNTGTDHRKFMRMITVYVDIIAPLYWWKEFDTYKVGTVANSCSTMHKIAAKEFTLEDFSHEHLISDWIGDNNDAVYYWYPKETDIEWFASPLDGLRIMMGLLNTNRQSYLKTHDKKYWWQMIQLLPSSYNQKRTIMLNYEVLANMYKSRRNHKLDEWHVFCDWIKNLPYSELIIGGLDGVDCLGRSIVGIDLAKGADLTGGEGNG